MTKISGQFLFSGQFQDSFKILGQLEALQLWSEAGKRCCASWAGKLWSIL